MNEVIEQEFYDFLASFKENITMRKSSLIHPVTVSFYHDNERVAAIIINERDNLSTMSYFIKDKK